jgi:UDP-N-acetylglucosamine 2-epimerase (non-hydrolysing)
MLIGLEPVLQGIAPDVVFVQGDTNSVLAGALMASRLGIRVAHVEAGLRSYDRRMPEEANRILADNLSEYLLAPTAGARDILLSEGFPETKIAVTGNTVVDSLQRFVRLAGQEDSVEKLWQLRPGEYVLVTLHRPENVDERSIFLHIIEAIGSFCGERDLAAVIPVHPRTARRLAEFGIQLAGAWRPLPAVDYLSFLRLEKQARLIVTDSGGVQEEACILGVPCVTVRLSTERPETVAVGANLVTGVEPEAIIEGAARMIGRKGGWSNPFGDGRAGERIVEFVLERENSRPGRGESRPAAARTRRSA